MKNFSTWLTVVMLVIFTTMTLIALGYPAGAQFMPLIVGIPGIVLCLIQLGSDYYYARKGGAVTVVPGVGEHVDPEALPEFGPHTIKSEIRTWIYFLVFMTGVLLFGFIIAVPIMIFTYLAREAKASLVSSGIAALVTVTVMYLMFERLLHLQLHPGFITPMILKAVGL